MSSPVTTLLASAGLPADNLLTKREMLPEPLQLLHRRTLLALGTGRGATDARSAPGVGERAPNRP